MQAVRHFGVVILIIGSVISTSLASADDIPPEKKGLLSGWTGDVFAGYSKSVGNTQKSTGNINARALKKFDSSEFLLKGNVYYSESNKSMDSQKWDILAKLTHSFGRDDNWFSFTQVLVDHDYFSDINYRITPSVGMGYHIFKTDDFIWDVDGGFGYRITRHRVNTAADDDALTAIVHSFAKKKILDNAYLSEDLTVYPGLKSDSGILIRSASAFTNPLSTNLDLEMKYIIDYNSQPAAGKTKTDGQFIAGLKYKF